MIVALSKFKFDQGDQGSSHKTSSSSKLSLLEFRAKYIRSTTPLEEGGSSRIAKHAVPRMKPRTKVSSLPSINTFSSSSSSSSSSSVPLFSPRSFDGPVRTPFVAPSAAPPPARLSTPEFKAAVNFKLGPEAPLLWSTLALTKKQYPKEHGGAELRGQTRALAYRYMRYIYGAENTFNDATLRKHYEEKQETVKKAKVHENVLANIIRNALDAEEVAGVGFNKAHITENQMTLILLKAATSQDHLQLFHLLLDEVTSDFLYNNLVPSAKLVVEDEITRRENDTLFNMDAVLSTYTLRQLRDELRRYGKEESEFRAELSKLPDVESPAIRGVLRKQCLISILLEQRALHGFLEKDEAVKAVERPWTRIIRTGTASAPEKEEEEDIWQRRRNRLEEKKNSRLTSPSSSSFHSPSSPSEDLFEDLTNKTVVDPYVRSQLVNACLVKYTSAKDLRQVMVENKVETFTPGLKGEERRVKLANNLVDAISKSDDLFRAWKAVLLQGSSFQIDTTVADDLLQNNATKPVSRSLSSRGCSSRRRNNSSRLKLRPQSQLWRSDNVAKDRGDNFTRPSSEGINTDWVKRLRSGDQKQQEWFHKVTGQVIPIHNFFSPESEAGGFGVDYLEKLLSRGVSLPTIPTNQEYVEGTSLADFSFIPDKMAAEGYGLGFTSPPASTALSREFDDDLEEFMRKQKLRLKQSGMYGDDKPGSNVAYQRSLLRAQKKYEKKNRYQTPENTQRNAFVLHQPTREDSDSADDSDVSDTEYIARHLVEQVEIGLPQFIFEEILTRFGAGPGKPPPKGGEMQSTSTIIEFRDDNYQSIEDFVFYYSHLEIPVARKKASLLVELLERVKRKNYDGFDPPDTDDEEDEKEEEQEEQEEEEKEKEEEEEAEAAAEEEAEEKAEEEEEEGGGTDGIQSNVFVIKEPRPEPEPPADGQKLEWKRYADDNNYPYFYNWRTGESTYENPFLSQKERDRARYPFLQGGSESESDDDETSALKAEKLMEKELAESITAFCAIMVQRKWRGGRSRMEARAWLAGLFRKIRNGNKESSERRRDEEANLEAAEAAAVEEAGKEVDLEPDFVYENVLTGETFTKRPILFKFLFPYSTF